MKYLYRILAVTVIVLPLLAPVTCAAQKKARSKLRALAVVELPASARVGPDMQMPASARLHAVTIFTNGEYQDASIYEVNPMPMALEPGTVYDVQQSGESLGLLTVESAGKAKDDWLASGKWKSEASITAAKQAPAPGPTPVQASDERPHLKRGGNQTAASQPAPAPSPAPNPPSTSAQPEPTPTPAPAPAPTPTPAEATQPAQESTAASSSTEEADPSEADPNRPTLRHRTGAASGKSTPPTQVERKHETARMPVSAHAPVRGSAQSTVPALNLPTPVLKRRAQAPPQFLVAISDASPYETHSYKFPWIADEQQQLTSAVEKQALAEMTAYAAKSSRILVPGSFAASVQAFDLYSDNNPEMVVTAKCALRKKLAPAKTTPLNAYITYVVGQEPSGNYSKLLSDITDDDHMDINGRLELVDAVDADGDSRAELLFRRVGVTTQSFELYRAGRDQLWKLFDGAEIQKN
ncbi:MAG TPA: hypothetical protein VK699_07715 [Terriglobales bacterium]|nr:hypothetical protein [Terriglobales bacterium]